MLSFLGFAGRGRPAATHLFFASPKKSKQKKGDPQSGSGFLGSEPQFTEPSPRPKGAVLCTAVKWVSDPNNPLRCLRKAGVRHKLASLKQVPALIPLFSIITGPARTGWGAGAGSNSPNPIPNPNPIAPFCMRRGAEDKTDKGSCLFERSEFARDPVLTEHRGCP